MNKIGIIPIILTLSLSHVASANVTSFTSSLSQVRAQSTITWDTLYEQTQQDANPTGMDTSIGIGMGMNGTLSYSEAAANLATGQLTAMSYVSNQNWAPYNVAFARADFGDSFRTYNQNGPFSWTNGTTASFNIDLSGLIGGLGGTNGSRFGIIILAPGTLDAYYNWLTTNDPNAYNTWSNAAIQYFDYWIGPDSPGENWITQTFTTFPAQATASFAPGGDFDWAMYLITDASTSSPFSNYTVDFSHTANITYSSPTGTTTVSASGLFPGTVAMVPEPETYALMLVGLILVGTAAQRRRDT